MSLIYIYFLFLVSIFFLWSVKSGKEGKGDKEKEEGNKDIVLVVVK